MMRAFVGSLALALFLLGFTPAIAHQPYFTQVELITLPDGSRGEMHLLHGDGVFISIVRVIVVDGDKKLLAHNPHEIGLSLICDGEPRSCRGYDHSGNVLTPDPVGLRKDGTVVPSLTEREKGALGPIEAGEESWGFRIRPATSAEMLAAKWAHVRKASASTPLSLSKAWS